MKNNNYYVLSGPPEKIKEATVYCVWSLDSTSVSPAKIQQGDILLFYSSKPINGIVGFGTVRNIKAIDELFIEIEFDRNYCLPDFLWLDEKIKIQKLATKNEFSQLNNKSDINEISKLTALKWGTELRSELQKKTSPISLISKNLCIECGKEIISRKAKYCDECGIKVRKRQSKEWNKRNKEKLREAERRWRQRNLEKVREYSRRWKKEHPEKVKELKEKWRQKHREKLREYNRPWGKKHSKKAKKLKKKGEIKHKEIKLSEKTDCSDWCKTLRKDPIHVSWMIKHKKRKIKIDEIEKKYNCCWEDKFREAYMNHKREDAAKLLDLNNKTLNIWAKHLGLKRECIYCRQKLSTKQGNYHISCKEIYEPSPKTGDIEELLSKINFSSMINLDVLKLNSNEIREILKAVLSYLSERESFIIENRYLHNDPKKNKSLTELGQSLGISRERVRQLEARAFKKLSNPSNLETIKEELHQVIFQKKDSDSNISPAYLIGEYCARKDKPEYYKNVLLEFIESVNEPLISWCDVKIKDIEKFIESQRIPKKGRIHLSILKDFYNFLLEKEIVRVNIPEVVIDKEPQ